MKVRIGERFVFDDRGGVFQRVSWEKSRCIYGSNFGTELEIDPEVSVYAIFDKDKFTKANRHESSEESVDPEPTAVPVRSFSRGSEMDATWQQTTTTTPVEGVTMKVAFIDESDKVLHEIECVSAAQVAALTGSDFIRIKVPNMDVDVFRVSDVGFDYIDQKLCVTIEPRDA